MSLEMAFGSPDTLNVAGNLRRVGRESVARNGLYFLGYVTANPLNQAGNAYRYAPEYGLEREAPRRERCQRG
jgi:hypothetical protein